jgi:hypothetical protein
MARRPFIVSEKLWSESMHIGTILVFGPSLDMVDEPQPPPPPPPPRAHVVWRDPAVEPGGKVHLAIAHRHANKWTLPARVYVVYVPKGMEPDLLAAGPEAFLGSGHPLGSMDIDDSTENIDIEVPGVAPGLYFVQTILEYAYISI